MNFNTDILLEDRRITGKEMEKFTGGHIFKSPLH
jgi:hypothetical protein